MIFYAMVFTTGVAVGTVATLWLLSLPREERPDHDALREAEWVLKEARRGRLPR